MGYRPPSSFVRPGSVPPLHELCKPLQHPLVLSPRAPKYLHPLLLRHFSPTLCHPRPKSQHSVKLSPSTLFSACQGRHSQSVHLWIYSFICPFIIQDHTHIVFVIVRLAFDVITWFITLDLRAVCDDAIIAEVRSGFCLGFRLVGHFEIAR